MGTITYKTSERKKEIYLRREAIRKCRRLKEERFRFHRKDMLRRTLAKFIFLNAA